jgi:hypothetical protein
MASQRLPRSGNPNYADQFRGFVTASPGALDGPLAPIIQTIVVRNIDLASQVAKYTELIAGAVLVVTAVEVLRRRFSGPLGAPHGYEPLVALLSAAAAFALASTSLTIYLLQGGRLPTIDPMYAFSSPISIELLIVPLALAIAFLEFGRFRALRVK